VPGQLKPLLNSILIVLLPFELTAGVVDIEGAMDFSLDKAIFIMVILKVAIMIVVRIVHILIVSLLDNATDVHFWNG
jgi:hypothetical protein